MGTRGGTYVLVQCNLANRPQRIILIWDRTSYIEDIPLILLCVLGFYYLDRHGPAGVFTAFDSLEQIPRLVIGVLPCEFFGFLASQVLDPLVGFHVDLDVFEVTILTRVSRFGWQSQSPTERRTDLVNLKVWLPKACM